MKILFVFVLFSGFSFAGYSERDCVKEFINYTMFNAMLFELDRDVLGRTSGSCDTYKENPTYMDNFKRTADRRIQVKNNMTQEMKLKKTVTAEKYFHRDDIEKLSPEISNEEVCELVDAEILAARSCWYPKEYLEKFREIDITHRDILDLCQEHFPQLQKIEKSCPN